MLSLQGIIACHEQNQLVSTDAYQILGDTFSQQNIPKKIQEQHAQGVHRKEINIYDDNDDT